MTAAAIIYVLGFFYSLDRVGDVFGRNGGKFKAVYAFLDALLWPLFAFLALVVIFVLAAISAYRCFILAACGIISRFI